ncbi:MAG TPA: hypothetical protein PK711_03425 [Bacteroidales bacterium]|nr:hypothetical protein [Bacteroidales bacterium]
MKKIIFTIAMVVCSSIAFSQPSAADPQNGGGSRDTHNFQCMSDVAFSQVPVEYNSYGYCNVGYRYPTVADDYTATDPFSQMRFWGVDEGTMQASENFTITFYNGVPGEIGTSVVGTYYETVAPVATGYTIIGETIYRFDVDFGTFITQLNGWVSISRTTVANPPGLFGWLSYRAPDGGRNARSYDDDDDIWRYTGWEGANRHDVFFCLGGTEGYHDFVCTLLGQSYFSQVPYIYDIGMYCDAGYTYTKVADDYSASNPFSNMRFWGVYDVKPTETFLIEFYDGVPGGVGTNIVKTYNVTVNPVATPYLRLGSVIHQFDVNFGETITLTEGWVSISRTTVPYTTEFAWIGRRGTGNSLGYNSTVPQWQVAAQESEMFFCLGVGLHTFECMDNAVFSQVPDVYSYSYYCDASYSYTKVADNYSASGPFSSMRFWGASYWGYGVGVGETFLVEFYNGQPGLPGTSVVKTFNVTGSCVQTAYQQGGTYLYQIDLNFPEPVTQTVGWVSISSTTASNAGIFGWLTSADASTSMMQYYSPESGWFSDIGTQFFCLGPVTYTTPVANWALYLGIGLILAFTVIRLRKIF